MDKKKWHAAGTSERSRDTGARQAPSELMTGFMTDAGAVATVSVVDDHTTPSETIEGRLEAKAHAADCRDYPGQRSLGEMQDGELIAFLSGG